MHPDGCRTRGDTTEQLIRLEESLLTIERLLERAIEVADTDTGNAYLLVALDQIRIQKES